MHISELYRLHPHTSACSLEVRQVISREMICLKCDKKIVFNAILAQVVPIQKVQLPTQRDCNRELVGSHGDIDHPSRPTELSSSIWPLYTSQSRYKLGSLLASILSLFRPSQWHFFQAPVCHSCRSTCSRHCPGVPLMMTYGGP